ncbi:DUF6371 domain-containing protein [Psychroflexus sp. CAK1W]|uniref:DUF6371 domain-containing protein n=1 Tax=Psychroflexus curvus TaxID=2873595 RepID=UPI001CCD2CF5|nr:DUF6371 domain-containing protein [Psychroflexus curvus]MBZ9627432.1 DUF6371 domain-containing protein [Psychroflexus curvus]
MNNYRYTLEPYKGDNTRYRCPGCKKKNEFTRYVDLHTQRHIAENVGICNNTNKCGYHYPPREYFRDNIRQTTQGKRQEPKQPDIDLKQVKNQEDKISHYHTDLITKYKTNFYDNKFLIFFSKLLGRNEVNKWIELYNLGTYNKGYLKGSTIFWQVDQNLRVRTGKIMKYDQKTGKRLPKMQNWYHSINNKDNFNLKQVPFGLHLLRDYRSKKIAIVESEKTACLMSTFMPDFLWLAIGSCQNLTYKMLSEIKNRDIILFPDAGKYELWRSKIQNLPTSNFYEISDLLHLKSTKEEKERDFDIADYCLSMYLKEV